ETCNRIRKIVEKYPWENVAKGLRITMSFGVTSYREGDTLKSLMIRADDALYRAKRNGRNRVERS
ncbi:MAG: diguanylate cyclase, partial [Undibacterium sp.]|nr:diguanylate cyclase [Undibacterium sp.]